MIMIMIKIMIMIMVLVMIIINLIDYFLGVAYWSSCNAFGSSSV